MKAEHVAKEVERREKERAEQASIPGLDTGEAHLRNVVILGADTIVVLDGQILGKPSDEEAAFSMLKSLQGRMHQVYTGVAVLDFDGNGKRHTISHAEETKVYVHEMTDEDHVELLDALKSHQGPVLVSGYASEMYDSELTGWRRETTTTTDQTSRVRQEVLWMNFEPSGQESLF